MSILSTLKIHRLTVPVNAAVVGKSVDWTAFTNDY